MANFFDKAQRIPGGTMGLCLSGVVVGCSIFYTMSIVNFFGFICTFFVN